MIDRVTDDMGRLGPVNDSKAMAKNILDVWKGDRAAMGRRACEHALQFSWERSMEQLFGEIYPAAFKRRDQRLRKAGAKAAKATA
jgi:alpha-1,6-mannosyltransferase